MSDARRVGLMVPSSNTAAEPDTRMLMPDGIEVHTARMFLAETSAKQEKVMLERHAPTAAADLGTLFPELVIFSCTSAGALLGVEGERRLVSELAELAGAEIVSTNASVAAWMSERSMHRISVLTAYTDELNVAIEATLSDRGFDVARIDGFGITDNFAIAAVSTDEIVKRVERSVGDADVDVDGIFISCTNLRAVEAADQLARGFGIPVVSSNLAVTDVAMSRLGLPMSGHGLP